MAAILVGTVQVADWHATAAVLPWTQHQTFLLCSKTMRQIRQMHCGEVEQRIAL
jgi:hypothetical protein